MRLIEFHTYRYNSLISVNPDAIAQVGSMPDRDSNGEVLGEAVHAYIVRLDGGSVELTEDYEYVQKVLRELR